jgi:hypothetical protein
MSDHYIIGENQTVSLVSAADYVCALNYSGTTYVYWRSSTVGDNDSTAVIAVSTSTDGITWSTPLVAYTDTGYDIYPAGVVRDGTEFKMAFASKDVNTGAMTTKFLSSPDGLAWIPLSTHTWTEYRAWVTDFHYVGSTYYLVATTMNTVGAPYQTVVKTSTNLTSWTSLGSPSRLTTVGNVGARIAVHDGQVEVVHREGDLTQQSEFDRILHTRYANGIWSSQSVVVEGTGQPDICALDTGFALIYKDQSVEGGQGIWSWYFYVGVDFFRRGTFSQNFEYGVGGTAISTDTGFQVLYSTRQSDASTAGLLYSRKFTGLNDEPSSPYFPAANQRLQVSDPDELVNFMFEISSGQYWVSLSDGMRYYVSPEEFGTHTQTLRRITAQSPFYEGTYLIHAVRENVQENVVVHVLGVSQNDVTENLLLLEELISQPSFKLRLTMQDHVETWSCQQADYVIERGHIMMHNTRATMRLSVPRLPEVTYEVT